jgi:hypothetical protein
VISWPRSVVDAVARRRAVVFIGAGVSMNSVSALNGRVRPPSWGQFLERCIARCSGDVAVIQEYFDQGDYLTCCELLKVHLEDEWSQILTDEFLAPQYMPADIHKHILQLDLRIVLTQNFDKIYDVYAQSTTNSTTRISSYYDADTSQIMRGDYRGILKVHGTIDHPSTTVFTREEYSKMRNEHSSFQSLIDALFLTHTFVFLGCSLSDPDLRLFLENHAVKHPSAPVHFMTSPKSEIPLLMDNLVKRNYNLKLLRYDDDVDHNPLTSSLSGLVEEVNAARDSLAGTQNW